MGKLVRNQNVPYHAIAAIMLGAILTLSSFRFLDLSSVSPMTVSTKNAHVRTDVLLKTQTRAEVTPEITEQCWLTLGDWCTSYKTQAEIARSPPPQGNISCLWNCNNVGVCDGLTGFCLCPAGWQGDACDVRMRRPCSQKIRDFGFQPYDEPVDWSVEGGLFSRCAGECEYDTGMCYCPANTKYGRVPAAPDAVPGTAPTRWGRPMGMHCQPNFTPDGTPTAFGDKSKEQLDDWCNADQPKVECPCYDDYLGGVGCNEAKEQFCLNQCNGHGECLGGFCKCHEGWFGQDCAYRMEGVTWAPGFEEHRPWVKQFVHTPASWDNEKMSVGRDTRKRPLIYIYELPPKYNTMMLQYKNDQHMCHHRCFEIDKTNNSVLYHNTYNIETGLHEYLLQSEHRTLDPEEADFYYIPIYITCQINPVHWYGDFPHFHGGPVTNRVQAATNMMLEAFSFLKSHYPYWNRNGGSDHILLSAHDEGSCYVPSLIRNATILSHWGNTAFNNVSHSNYVVDRFDQESKHRVYQPEGHLNKIGLYPCYDPGKDLILPSMWPPQKYQASPLFGNQARERTILAFHKGRLMLDEPDFSRGTRQRLFKLAEDNGWWGKHRIFIGEGNPTGFEKQSYTELLASSLFCLVLQGDGWTSRFEDAITHGCIPVVLIDGVHMPFDTILDSSEFSIGIKEKDMGRLPAILSKISKSAIKEYQVAISKVWRRYFYSGAAGYSSIVRQYLSSNKKKRNSNNGPSKPQSLPAPEYDWVPGENDAFMTIIQWLYHKKLQLDAQIDINESE